MFSRLCARTGWRSADQLSVFIHHLSHSAPKSRTAPFTVVRPHLLLPQNTSLRSRTLSSATETQSSHGATTKQDFSPVYVCKFIVHLKVLSRLKIYQTALTCLGYPPLVYLFSAGAVSIQSFTVASSVAALACVMLYVMSAYIMRVVGMISVNSDESLVKISHLSFWGKRRDLFVKPEDIVPLSDMSDDSKDVYRMIKLYSSRKSFYFFQRYGRVDNLEALENVLGSLK